MGEVTAPWRIEAGGKLLAGAPAELRPAREGPHDSVHKEPSPVRQESQLFLVCDKYEKGKVTPKGGNG